MKKLSTISLLDVLPESILLDPKLKASAEALDAQLKSVTAATREVLHLPRLDELSGNILDYLAEQFHLDFFEPLYLTETEKRNLIRESIAWHRIKGTPAAVEKIARDVFRDAKILEWFEYGGEPYHFKIQSKGYKETPDGWLTYLRMVDVAKNVRSWCDNYEVIFDEDIFGKSYAFAGAIELQTGDKAISLAKPKLDSETKIFAGNSNLIFGDVTESLQRPKLKFGVPIFAGTVDTRVGNIKIGTATEPHDTDNYIAHSWTGKIFAGTADGFVGRKVWSLARPKNQQAELSIGIAEKSVGEIFIKPEPKLKISQQANLHAAPVFVKAGNVKVETSTRPDEDGNYFSHKWQSQTYAGNAELRHGDIRINYKPAQRRGYKSVVRVGAIQTFSGEITIGCEDADDEDFPLTGDWIRLRFRFPNLSKKFITLRDPRDDVEKSDIREVGNIASNGGVLINRVGQTTTGIDLAMLIRRREETIL